MKAEKAGEYLALVAIVVGVLAGLAAPVLSAVSAGYVAALLVVLGIVVGLVTVSEKEISAFLIASIALLVGAAVVAGGAFGPLDQVVSPLGTVLNAVFRNVAVFVAPMALISAFKAVWALASRK